MLEEQNFGLKENQNCVRPKKIFAESLHLLFYLLLVFLSAYLILHFIGQRTQVLGQSMENTLLSQDNLIVDKLSYHFMKPHRYDIVVFPVDKAENVAKSSIIGKAWIRIWPLNRFGFINY